MINSPNGAYTVADWVIEKDGQFEMLRPMLFKEQMAKYIADYPELLDRVNKIQLEYSLDRDDTEAIIRFYNDRARMVLK